MIQPGLESTPAKVVSQKDPFLLSCRVRLSLSVQALGIPGQAETDRISERKGEEPRKNGLQRE